MKIDTSIVQKWEPAITESFTQVNVFTNVSSHFLPSGTGGTVLQVYRMLQVLQVLQVPIFYFH